jgi:hypothetical protein
LFCRDADPSSGSRVAGRARGGHGRGPRQRVPGGPLDPDGRRPWDRPGVQRERHRPAQPGAGQDQRFGRRGWSLPLDIPGRLIPKQHNIWSVLGISDRHRWPTGDGYWCLDAATVRKLASKEYDRALRAEVYQLNAYPAREDRLSRYRCTRDKLWRRLFSGQRLAQATPLRFPVLELDQGASSSSPPSPTS